MKLKSNEWNFENLYVRQSVDFNNKFFNSSGNKVTWLKLPSVIVYFFGFCRCPRNVAFLFKFYFIPFYTFSWKHMTNCVSCTFFFISGKRFIVCFFFLFVRFFSGVFVSRMVNQKTWLNQQRIKTFIFI